MVGGLCLANPRAFADPSTQVPQAIVESRVVRLPVSDAGELRFGRLSTSQGLSQTRVGGIVQDNKGFLWFGTQYGLNRYDGYRFKVFKHEAADPDSLSGARILSLFKDHAGILWVGCLGALDRLDPQTERITHYEIDPHTQGSRAATVNSITEDPEGSLWLSTGSGLYRLDPATGRATRFGHDAADPRSLSSDDIKSAGFDRAGTFWVASSEGLDAFDRNTHRITYHIPLRELRELSFHEDSHGVFWILSSSGDGLAVFDRATGRLTRYAFNERDIPGAPLTGVIAMLEDRRGNLWLGTLSDGLLRYDRDRGKFIRYRHQVGNADSLAENRVTALFEDREGNVWVGLGATAPNFFADEKQQFATLPYDRSDGSNLGETLVNSILEDTDGTVWFGTTGALDRLDRSGGLTAFHVPGNGLDADVVSIVKDGPQGLWLATSGQGLYRFDPRTGRSRGLHHDPRNPASLSSDIVLRLMLGRDGRLWARTWSGIDRFDEASETFEHFLTEPQGTPEFVDIAQDASGAVWANDSRGFVRLDPGTGAVRRFAHDRNTGRAELTFSIHIGRDGAVWSGTQDGLLRLDPDSGAQIVYREQDGLPSNAIGCVLEDGRGDLWMSTTQGIARFEPASRTFSSYSVADGLPGNDLTGWGACHAGASGRMYFGGFPGATAFRPEDIRANDFVPPVVLTDLEVAGVRMRPERGSLLSRAISYTESLELSHEQNNITLGFSALSFRSPSTNRYRYRLEGFDTEWRRAGSDRRIAAYTALPAGRFLLRIQGATNRGPWSEPGTTLRIDVLPPWYATWWFRLVTVGAAALLVWAVYLLRMRQIARQFEIRLDERIRERTRIARELHDSLLQGFQGLMFRLQAVLNMLPGRGKEAVEALRVALDKGDQAIAEARAAVEELRSSTLMGDELTQTLKALMDELVSMADSTPRPTCRVRVEGKSRVLVSSVRDELHRIAREALRNAFRHSHARTIEGEVSYGDTTFTLRVRDDGAGINAQVLERGRRSGHWGLPGMRERTALLGGEFELWSEAGAGTEVQVTLPASVAYAAGRPG